MNGIARPAERRTSLMLATLAKCPRRYEIEFVNNYRLKGRRPAPWPPSIKSLLREALRERDFTTTRNVGALRTRAASEAIMSVYYDELRTVLGNVPAQEAAEFGMVIAQVVDESRRIMRHYEEAYRGDRLVIAVDKTGAPFVDRIVERKLLASEMTFAERVDAIVEIPGRTNENGKTGKVPEVAVLVRRFTSNSNPDDVRSDLVHDLALRGQLWAASHLVGDPVTVAIVDVVRTKAPSIPDTVQCRKCGGQGRHEKGQKEEDGTWTPAKCETCEGTGVGGMSKRACDTTESVWMETARANGLDATTEAARCSDVIGKIRARGETFAYRVEVEVQVAELKEWSTDAVALASIAEVYATRKHWPRNQDACVGRSGPCPYRKVCSHQGDADVAWFTKTDEPYPGLA